MHACWYDRRLRAMLGQSMPIAIAFQSLEKETLVPVFVETIAICGALALTFSMTVIVLALFFKALSRWSRPSPADALVVRGVLHKGTLATVEMSGSTVYERVRLMGILDAGSAKGPLPWELNGMVILEEENGTRVLVRAKDIRRIVIPRETGSNAG